MKKEQLERMTNGKGFIAALDQSGGSTPKALRLYGIAEDSYQGDDEMFDLVHAMRARIIKSPALHQNIFWGRFFLKRPWTVPLTMFTQPITSGRKREYCRF